MLHLFLVASSYGRRAVQFKGGTLWNNLPAALQSPMSLGTFKIKIKQYLLTSLSSVLQTIYFAFVHPHILYGIEMYRSVAAPGFFF